ncbi:MAG: signal recognition particle receptor subunit alpha [Candidatus Micrarchaeota archaeon]|nr:signal recognition particle receptor subunit alpha [Candidatus Micrarchaeota archaeon]MCX8154249.1 signal recognition particle receptor subunit alpha [Candidatus Micrarchaeota archaeon]
MISLRPIIEKFLGKPILDRTVIDEFILEIQKNMLLADIPPKVVFDITNRLKQEISKERFPSKQFIIRSLYNILKEILGDEYSPDLRPRRIMLVGLYGSGKTTTAAKLWKFFSSRGIPTRVTSMDDERPAGKDQLRVLVRDYQDRFNPKEGEMWIVDTPGKSVEDKSLVEKLIRIKQMVRPEDTWLVIGADTGKYAERLAQGLVDLGITGVVITKIDGSGKAGGAFLAVRNLKIPIVFVGYGEKIDQLSPYNPDDLLSRMLGFINPTQLREIKEDFDENLEFNFETYLKQLEQLRGRNVDDILIGFGINLNTDQSLKMQEFMKKFRVMIDSMTPEERRKPELLKSSDSRIRRIARGSGLKEIEVRNMINRFFDAKRAFEKIRNDKGFMNLLKRAKF